jgi:hypothetical protein
MYEEKTDASWREQIIAAIDLASQTVTLFDLGVLPIADSYRAEIGMKLFTGLMGAVAAGVGRKQLCH